MVADHSAEAASHAPRNYRQTLPSYLNTHSPQLLLIAQKAAPLALICSPTKDVLDRS